MYNKKLIVTLFNNTIIKREIYYTQKYKRQANPPHKRGVIVPTIIGTRTIGVL